MKNETSNCDNVVSVPQLVGKKKKSNVLYSTAHLGCHITANSHCICVGFRQLFLEEAHFSSQRDCFCVKFYSGFDIAESLVSFIRHIQYKVKTGSTPEFGMSGVNYKQH